MVQAKIRPFRGQKDGKEDPHEYLEDLEWVYEQLYRGVNPPASEQEANKTYRLLFRQNLEGGAYEWYTNLDREVKQDWQKLREVFLKYYQITEKDAQAKKFELRLKIAQLKQEENESIAEYLKRAEDLSTHMAVDEIDLGMAMLRGMKDQHKKDQVNFECNKGADYMYTTVENLIKAAYSEVGKPNQFDLTYKGSSGAVLPQGSTIQTNDELLRQVLINTNQAFPAILQGFRTLNMAASNGVARNIAQQPNKDPPNFQRPREDLSEIQCYVCGQHRHYASYHKDTNQPVAANSAVPAQPQNQRLG
ncbi:MAG: hypothetical protein Q9163_004239 [Psora crenata]